MKVAPATQGLADGSGGADDVLFEDAAAKRRDAKQSHRNHSGRNGCDYGLSRAHSQIGIRGAEDEGQENSERDRFHGHLAGRLVRAVCQASMVSECQTCTRKLVPENRGHLWILLARAPGPGRLPKVSPIFSLDASRTLAQGVPNFLAERQ